MDDLLKVCETKRMNRSIHLTWILTKFLVEKGVNPEDVSEMEAFQVPIKVTIHEIRNLMEAYRDGYMDDIPVEEIAKDVEFRKRYKIVEKAQIKE